MMTPNFDQAQIEKLTKSATEQAEEFANLSKQSFEAWIKCTNILMDGAQNLMKSMTDMSAAARETQAAAMKQFMSCKTPNEMTEVSTKIAQQTAEQTMSSVTKLSEKTVKLAMDAIEPLNDTISKGFQKTMKKTAKAA